MSEMSDNIDGTIPSNPSILYVIFHKKSSSFKLGSSAYRMLKYQHGEKGKRRRKEKRQKKF
jgi:hypothetical protein